MKVMNGKIVVIAIVSIMIAVSFGAVGINTQVENESDYDCGCSQSTENVGTTDGEFVGLTDAEIADLQAIVEEKGYSFTVGRNSATERSLERLCGFVPQENTEEQLDNLDDEAEITISSALPSSFNWKDQGKVTSVKDQGSCGTCWAFGTVAPLESKILIKENLPADSVDLSEQWLVSCNTYGWSSNCNKGGFWAHGFHAGTAGKCGGTGAVLESEFSYTSGTGAIPGCRGPYTHYYLITDWHYVGSGNSVPSTDDIKDAIYNHGPVSAAVYVDSLFQAYNGGVFDSNKDGTINHAITLVGWNDDEGYWILKNSWGKSWGEDGYMRIKYGCQKVGYSACYIDDYNDIDDLGETVDLYIDTITNVGCEPIDSWPFEAPEWYYKVKIGNSPQQTVENLQPGDEIGFWPWNWVSANTWDVNRDHIGYTTSGDVTIIIELYDDDTDIPGDSDDHADISPKSIKDFEGNYNLVTDKLTYSDGTEITMDGENYKIKGTPDDNAEITFRIKQDSYNAGQYVPKLGVSPTALNFGAVKEGSPTLAFTITNTAPTDPRGWAPKLTWTASDEQSWITLSKTSGSLSSGTSEEVTVTAKADGLEKGTHSGTITIDSNDVSKKIGVTITKDTKAKTKTDILMNNLLYLFNQFKLFKQFFS
jgi:C1A family cysteine protease